MNTTLSLMYSRNVDSFYIVFIGNEHPVKRMQSTSSQHHPQYLTFPAIMANLLSTEHNWCLLYEYVCDHKTYFKETILAESTVVEKSECTFDKVFWNC